METKKTNRANLENKRGIFLELGFILALAISLLAFEWKTMDKGTKPFLALDPEEVELLLPVNTVQPKPLPPPPAPKPVVLIKEVGNDAPEPDDRFIIDVEIDPGAPNPDIFVIPDEPEGPDDDVPFIVVEQDPEFPGGLEALYKYLREHVHYPAPMREAGIGGTVFVNFVVERDGSLTSINVLRSPHDMLSEEAVRAIAAMPKWNPGKQRGQSVRVSFNLPIKFFLQ